METVGQADFATWHVPQCPFVIEYSRTLLAEIERAVWEAFYSAPRGGVETAGLLFGIHLEGVLRITAFRPMECEHLHGPGFLVSDKDLANLDALLERSSRDPILHGSALAGWYHSHTRSGIFLSDADLELHRRFFTKSWQVALVLCPSAKAAAKAGFFFQERDGTIRSQECYREFELAGAEPAVPRNQAAVSPGLETYRREVGLAASPRLAGSPISMRAANAPPARSVSAPPSMAAMAVRARPADAPAGKSKRRYWPWVVAGLVLGIGGASWYQSETLRPPAPARVAPLHLRATDQAGLLRIEWDRNTLVSTELLGGSLEIWDGETRTNVPLDRAAIRVGSFQVVRHSRVVRVALEIRVLGAGPVEEVTEYIGPVPSADAAKATPQAPDAGIAPRPGAASEKAVTETAAVRPPANRPAERPSDKQDQRNKEERSSDFARRETTQAPAAPPRREAPSTPVPTQVTGSSPVNTAPPRQQIAEAARPPAPAVSSPARPPADTPVTPAASQTVQNNPSIPRPGPAASQPSGSGTAVSPASASSPAPKAAPTVVQPPRPSLEPLSGHWVHGADGPTGSPFPPESLLLTLNESAGQLRGSFSGSYKVPKNRKLNGKVDFQFAGPATAGWARFPLTSADGSKGEVEIIRVGGHIDTIEVVWHLSRDGITFDDVFQRVP